MITEKQYNNAREIVRQYESEKLGTSLAKNSECRLGRFPNRCSIIMNTSFKTCDGCGHSVQQQVTQADSLILKNQI